MTVVAVMSATDVATVTLEIDGRELTVPKGTPLVLAAAEAGVEIPIFCYEPRLGPAIGACRMCLVEVEGMPKLQAACTMTAGDGMKVHTRSASRPPRGRRRCSSSSCSTTRSTAPSATRAASARCRT